MKKLFAERPLARFALLSFSLPIITLILLVVFAQMPQDILSSNEPCHREDDGVLLVLFFLVLLLTPQFYGITGLIFYGRIVNDKALTHVGIKNVALLVIGSVLTTLAFFFIYRSSYLSPFNCILFIRVSIFQLGSTLILIAIRYAFWKRKQRRAKE